MTKANDFLIVYCTCPDEKIAKDIACNLVNKKLAACVNVLPQITSVYTWQQQLKQDKETLLIIKTSKELFSALEAHIITMHPYDTPEIIASAIDCANSLYLAWLKDNIQTL